MYWYCLIGVIAGKPSLFNKVNKVLCVLLTRIYSGTAHHIFQVSPPLCVRQGYAVGLQCFLSSLVAVTGSVRLFRWLGMGSHWQWNAPCLQVRRPPTAPLLKQSIRGLCTSYTDGIKGMCEQHEHHRDFRVSPFCLHGYHQVFSWQTNTQILFEDIQTQTEMCMYTQTQTHKENVGTHSHNLLKALREELLYFTVLQQRHIHCKVSECMCITVLKCVHYPCSGSPNPCGSNSPEYRLED